MGRAQWGCFPAPVRVEQSLDLNVLKYVVFVVLLVVFIVNQIKPHPHTVKESVKKFQKQVDPHLVINI